MSVLSKNLHERLRGKFNSLTMGRDDGAKTLVPDEAVFFEFQFTEGANDYGSVVVSILDEGALKVYFKSDIVEDADGEGKTKWYDFLKDLRFFSSQNMLNYEAKNITKSRLDKGDFDFLVGQNKSKDAMAMESKLYGSRQKSYQDLNGAKLIVQHTKTVDEEKMGSRSRNISAIYIENSLGERLRFENNYLPGARAMARHVSNGGYQNDEYGEHISEIMAEMSELKTFVRGVKRDDYVTEDSQEIIDLATDRYYGLKSTLESISKQKGYVDYFESYEPHEIEVEDDDINDLRTKLTREVFDDRLEGSLGAVSRAMKIKEKEGDVDFNTYPKWKKEAERRGFTVSGDESGATATDADGKEMGAWGSDAQFAGTSSEEMGYLEFDTDDMGIGDFEVPEKLNLMPGGKWTYQDMDLKSLPKQEQVNAMLRFTLNDIADRATDDEVQNFAARMGELVGSEGTAFGLRTVDPDEYKREKRKAVDLVKMAITQPRAVEGPKEDVESAEYDPMQEYEDSMSDIIGEKAKPDYLDFDKDGDKDEPMKKALKDKEKKDESIEEGTWALPDSAEKVQGLVELLKNPIPLGGSGEDAINVIGEFIGDDELYDALMDAGDQNPEADARPFIMKAMERLDITQKEEVDLDEEPNEGNKFSGELAKAKEDGEDEFEVDGKKYKVEGKMSDKHLEIQEMIEDGKSDEEISKATGFSVKDIKAVRKQVSNEPAEYDESIEWLKKAAGVGSTANSNFGIREGEQGYQKKLRDEIGKYLESLN